MGWLFKDYLFNVRIKLDKSHFECFDSNVRKDLSGKIVSVREDGVISLRPRKKLPTYDADLDLDNPAHLDFPGERPVIEMKRSFADELFAVLGIDISSPGMQLTTAKIGMNYNSRYTLDIQRS